MSVLKIFCDGDESFSVWLDTEVADHDGICISFGRTRQEAITEAVQDLKERLHELQLPPAAFQSREQDRSDGTVEVMDASA